MTKGDKRRVELFCMSVRLTEYWCKVRKVIGSCTTKEHLEAAWKLVNNLERMTKEYNAQVFLEGLVSWGVDNWYLYNAICEKARELEEE